jgi:hypothetical protein
MPDEGRITPAPRTGSSTPAPSPRQLLPPASLAQVRPDCIADVLVTCTRSNAEQGHAGMCLRLMYVPYFSAPRMPKR